VLCHGYMELRYLLQEALQNSAQAIASVGAEFRELFGRDYTGLLWQDRLGEAEVAIVAMGSLAMEARVAADSLRRSGLKVGVLGLRVFRPFPKSEVAQALGHCRLVVIFDRDISYGSEGAISLEIKSALYRRRAAPVVRNFIVGLGGRDVKAREIAEAVTKSLASLKKGTPDSGHPEWICEI
jgi:pyruvate/2-oxoacid:ferredoxin oxidoreductase alpha subunit